MNTMVMPQLPVILSTFAQSPDQKHLPALQQERQEIITALQPAKDSGAIQVVAPEEIHNENIPQLLAQHPNQVVIFHFGGHAEANTLLAADGSIFVEGLADQLALQSQLQLVFLNGCDTQSQVKHFIRQDIPIVLATTCNIDDGQARYFASHFYRAIAERHSIKAAFKLAVGALKTRFEQYLGIDAPEALNVKRGLNLSDNLDQIPWQLYVQEGKEDFLDWRLRYPRGLTRLPSLQLETDCLGREQELNQLRNLLGTSSKVVLVSGLGGMGKTTLAAGYLQWLRNDYDSIAWINSGNDLMASLAWNDDLAKNLEIPFVEKEKIEDRFARVMIKLRNQPGRNLLVIDDVNNQISDIATQLPSGSNWQVLVTSRQPLPDFQEMKLGVLHPNDALRLFRLHFQEGTDEEVQALLVEINYHTLTIEVMAKTLNRLNGLLTVPELLAILQERKLDDPRLQELVYTRHAGEERAIFFHLMKAFELAKLPKEEVWLMQQYAVLPAIPIEVKTLADWMNHEPIPFNRMVNSLSDKGWVQKRDQGFSMHRIIQEIVKYQNNPGVSDLAALIESMGGLMTMGDTDNPVSKNFPWVVHAQHVADHCTSGSEFPGFVKRLLNNCGNVLFELGHYEQAQSYFLKILKEKSEQPEEDEFITLIVQSNYAKVLKALGLYQAAMLLLESSINDIVHKYPAELQRLEVYYNNLGMIYLDIGEYQKGIHILTKVLEIVKTTYSPNDPALSINLTNLALAYHQAGQTKKAVKLMENALKIDTSHLEPDHPSIAIDQSNLASMYQELGHYHRAEPLFRAALSSSIQNFGENHPKTVLQQSNLGLLLGEIDQLEEARDLLEKAIISDVQRFGENHPDVARSQTNLGLVLIKSGQPDQAIAYLEKALETLNSHLEEGHPSISIIQSNLASAYHAKGDFDNALHLLESALMADLEHLGHDHPNIAIRKNNIAQIYISKNELPLAKQYFEEALSIVKQNYGRFHPYCFAIKHSLKAIQKQLQPTQSWLHRMFKK